MATITVVRVPSSLGGTARQYRILVDGAERGRLRKGEELEFDAPASDHLLQARLDWSGSEVATGA